jgi:hypothetical protein
MIFEESLRLPKRTRLMLVAVIGILILLFAVLLFIELSEEGGQGPENSPYFLVPIVLFSAMYMLRIKVTLDPDSLTIRAVRIRRTIRVRDIKSVKIEGYDPINAHKRERERWVLVEQYNGPPCMVSTERPEELERAIRALIRIE